jgi:hypothetical protein
MTCRQRRGGRCARAAGCMLLQAGRRRGVGGAQLLRHPCLLCEGIVGRLVQMKVRQLHHLERLQGRVPGEQGVHCKAGAGAQPRRTSRGAARQMAGHANCMHAPRGGLPNGRKHAAPAAPTWPR